MSQHEPATETAVLDRVDGSAELRAIQGQLDRLDVELLVAIRRRTALARQLVDARVKVGEPGFDHQQELLVVRRFLALGSAGRDVATVLLRLARIRPGQC